MALSCSCAVVPSAALRLQRSAAGPIEETDSKRSKQTAAGAIEETARQRFLNLHFSDGEQGVALSPYLGSKDLARYFLAELSTRDVQHKDSLQAGLADLRFDHELDRFIENWRTGTGSDPSDTRKMQDWDLVAELLATRVGCTRVPQDYVSFKKKMLRALRTGVEESSNFGLLGDDLANDKPFMLQALGSDYRCGIFLNSNLQNDKQFMLDAVKKDYKILSSWWASESLQRDPDLVRAANVAFLAATKSERCELLSQLGGA